MMDNLSAATVLKPLPNATARKMPRVTVLLMKLARENKRRWYGCYCVDHEPTDRLPWQVSIRKGANIERMGSFSNEGRALLFLAIHNNWRLEDGARSWCNSVVDKAAKSAMQEKRERINHDRV